MVQVAPVQHTHAAPENYAPPLVTPAPPHVVPAPPPLMPFVHQPVGRMIGDYLQPETTISPSCITFQFNAGTFQFRQDIIGILPIFYGLGNGDYYPHIRKFDSICNTFEDQRFLPMLIRLKLFSFSLKDKVEE